MSDATLKLRGATAADIELLVGFNCALALESESRTLDPDVVRAGVAAVLAQPRRGFYLLAQTAAGVVGGLLVTYEWSDWRNGDWYWIQSVYIEPAARRRGIFSAMHREVERRARAQDAVGVRLYVEWENARAQQTYAALGMQREHYHMYFKPFAPKP